CFMARLSVQLVRVPIKLVDATAAHRSLLLPPLSGAGAARAARSPAGDARPRRLRGGLRGDRPPLRPPPDPLRGCDRRLALGGRHPGRALEGAAGAPPR